jgi:hypothetical protein
LQNELFNGVWRIDPDRSKVWDDASSTYKPDLVGDEVITLKIHDGVQDYEVLYGENPVIVMGYTSRYDDSAWVPYLVRDLRYPGDRLPGSVEDFRDLINAADGSRKRRFEIGQPYGMIRTIYVDEHTHYRVSKSPDDGLAQSMMLRRMADHGQSYVATVLDVSGIVFRVRTFVRVDSC